MLNKRAVSTVMLVSCALIWGTAYIAQVFGMREIGPLTFCAGRFALSFAALALTLLFIENRREKKNVPRASAVMREERLRIILHGSICGLALFFGVFFQLSGLRYTTVGKAAFITATFIVIVPVYGLLAGKIPSRMAVASTLMSMAGLYMLSIKDGFSVGRGDLLVFIGAFFWAAHLMACSAFSKRNDPVKLSAVQFGTVAALAAAGSLILERPDFASVAASWPPILYAGILCTCVAFTFQMTAQRYVQPLTAGIIISTESIFASILGCLIFGETLDAREIAGCAVLFAASLTAQFDDARNAGA